MRLAPMPSLVLAALALLTATRAAAMSKVSARADVSVYSNETCGGVDVESYNTSLVTELDPADWGKPLYTFGEIRLCSVFSSLLGECDDVTAAYGQGALGICSGEVHAACGKSYKARTDGFLGTAWYGIGDTAWSGCDSRECPPLEE